MAAALLAAVGTIFAAWQSAGSDSVAMSSWVRRGPAIVFGGCLAAFAVLEYALFTNNFSVQFVASNHRRGTPAIFTATSAWAGLQGSLLLWGTIIAMYLFIVARKVGRDGEDRLGAGAVAVMSIVAAFFVGLVLFVAPTFTQTPRAVADGVR